MNERIQQILKQATEDILGVKVVNHNKFAELIIQQCASQIRFTDLEKCQDDSDGEILLQASFQLKQHFGVEQ